jgi:hypothetical protein
MWNPALDAWVEAAPAHGQLLSLNVGPDVLVDGLPWTLHERLPPNTVLELSEHAPVRSYAQLNAALDDWRAAGVAIAVDDVGAGHASLRHVLELQPGILDRLGAAPHAAMALVASTSSVLRMGWSFPRHREKFPTTPHAC